MNGVIYCRVSSKEQIEGTSLDSQATACRDYARQHNISVLKSFIERGESAKFADRTQLLELIDFCKENKRKVQILLVWKVDRFARNVGDHFSIKATLSKYGVRIVSVTEPIDANPEGKLMETILAGFAEFDNNIKTVRTVQGMRRKLQEGLYPWHPPMGYKTVTRKGEKKTTPDEPQQPLFASLQRAWKQFATGMYTKAEMRRLMTHWGIRNSTGHPISPQALDKFFRNPFYAGILIDPWGDEELTGKHIPMVSRGDFARVRQIIARRNRSVPHRQERSDFPLRGLVRCEECREYMTASISRGRTQRYPYYRCKNNKCAHRKSYQAKEIHEEFTTFLARTAPRPVLIERLGELVIQSAAERRASLKALGERIEMEIERLDHQVHELIRMRTEGLISDQEFVQQRGRLGDRRNAIEASRDSGLLNVETVRKDIGEIKQPIAELKATWLTLPPSLQRRFQRAVLPVGFVNRHIGTAEKAVLFSVLGDLRSRKTTVVPLGGESWNRVVKEITEFAEIFRGVGKQEDDPSARFH